MSIIKVMSAKSYSNKILKKSECPNKYRINSDYKIKFALCAAFCV